MKQLNKLRSMFLGETPIFDGGKEDGWIRYKDIYIQVLKQEDGGYELAWQQDIPSHFPLKDMHIAQLRHSAQETADTKEGE